MPKRKITPLVRHNLAEGRKKLAMNELKRRGINPNSQPRTIIQRVSVPGPTRTVHSTSSTPLVKVNFALFDQLFGAKILPVEINQKKEDVSLRQAINYLLSRLKIHEENISSNKNEIAKIARYVLSKNKKYDEKIKEMANKILELERENLKLKKEMEKNEDET